MHISHFDLQNFRKLECCRIELGKEKTLFVGANNSGKTSAMDALILFLKRPAGKKIAPSDFTLSKWKALNAIGNDWVNVIKEGEQPNLSREQWEPYLPSVDVWINVENTQIHYVSHLLPSLDWNPGLLGVRLLYEPRDVEDLFKRFTTAHSAAQKTMEARNQKDNASSTFSLWPNDMRSFLDKELDECFKIQAYILDPAQGDRLTPQKLPDNSLPLEGDPFAGLFKIDIINAQRGFSDPMSEESDTTHDRRLSVQLRKYFDKHLNPEDMPDENDIDALESIHAARTEFDSKLRSSFDPALKELEELNYPGFSNPSIHLSSNVKPLDSLNHDSAVLFSVNRSKTELLTLSEKYNGLGYQNLISMVFKLIRFRDEWMRVKKAGKHSAAINEIVEPLHLVLIEEPEAHLHSQVQQVFIRKAYQVLRRHGSLGINKQFITQMVVSTHSSHIAHEIEFSCLRYFKRNIAPTIEGIPTATVANLSEVFGEGDETSKFAVRYLKTTHCDLFFADAAILVEGPAERMLAPHFIHSEFVDLDKSYLTILEIGGSHAHRLRPLIEALKLPTLVITDLDPIEKDSQNKVPPCKGKEQRTRNSTIKEWVPIKEKLDEALAAKDAEKVSLDGNVRVAYQCPVTISFNPDQNEEMIPYTFEDALVIGNIDFFKGKTNVSGLIGKMASAVSKETAKEACEAMFEELKGGNKAEMALELLYVDNFESLKCPHYIRDGLEWLKNKLKNGGQEFPDTVLPGGES